MNHRTDVATLLRASWSHFGDGPSRERGHVMFFALMMLVLLGAFASAQVTFARKNIRQSHFFSTYSELYKYAESGIALAQHDLKYEISGMDGNMGAVDWGLADDTGRDGQAGTGDEGEGDNLPTPGEPNVAAVPIGYPELGIGLVTYVTNSGYSGVKRIVSTATDGDTLVTIERYDLEIPKTVPKTGAFYTEPDVVLDLGGNSFKIDGNDHNRDGTEGPGPALPAIATSEGEGDDLGILDQIDLNKYDQVTGAEGDGSVGTAPGVDFDTVFNDFKASQTDTYEPGSYSTNEFEVGDWDTLDLPVTYVNGDLELGGQVNAAGILVVDGNLTMSGQSAFTGLIVVNGDVDISGGGAGVHIWGSLIVGKVGEESATLKVSGNSDIFYSSEVMAAIEGVLRPDHDLVYYEEN